MPYKYEDDVHRPFIETQQVDAGSKKCCHSACVITAVAIILFILGVILAIGGPIFFKFGLPKVLREEIKKQVIIDSASAEGYNDWLVDQDDQVPVYYGYYLYNLTNANDVVNNHANPIYKQLGPYIYRRYKHKVNVEFMDDGNLVGYYSNRLYVFQPDMSNGSNADLITNVNPAYVGTVVVAGGDVNVIVGLSSPALSQMMAALEDPFLNMMISWNGASTLQTTFNNMMTGIATNFNNNTQQTLAFFCQSWADTTVQPAYYPEWFGMQLARGAVPTNISLQACASLFNATNTYSLVNTQEHASTTWMKASYDAAALQTLQTAFPGLTATQLNQVVWWRNRTFVDTVVVPQLLARFGLTDPQDLILQQWGTGGVIPNNVQAFFPEWSFGMSPEFWLLSTTTMDVPSARNVIFGPYAITVSLNMALLANPSTPGSLWGLSDAQKSNLFNYMGGIAQTLSEGMINQVFSEGGGIVTTKSVEEWLWNGTDPLLELLTPSDPYMAVQGPNNQTNGQTVIYTGKNDTDKINQYVMWRNQTSLDIWAKEYPIIGYTETGQFAPFMDDNEQDYTHLHPFDNNLIRTLDLYKNSTTSLYGVDLWRYLLNETCFLPDPLFFQTIAGMANLTSFEKGAPIFLSLWDFVLVDPKYTAKVTGVYPNTTDPTNIVDVEPITGITMSTVMKLQVNVYIPPNNNLFMFAFSNVTDDTFYPIVKIYRSTQITEHLASQFKDKVYLVQKLEVILFWVTLGVGVFLVAGCGLMLAIRHIRKRAHSIN